MNKMAFIAFLLVAPHAVADRYFDYLESTAPTSIQMSYINDIAKISLVFANTPDKCEVNMAYGAPLLIDGTMLLPGNCTPSFANIVTTKSLTGFYYGEMEKQTFKANTSSLSFRNNLKSGKIDLNSIGLESPNGMDQLLAVSVSSIPFWQHNFKTIDKSVYANNTANLNIFPFVSPQAYSLSPSDLGVIDQTNLKINLIEQLDSSEELVEQLPIYYLSLPKSLTSVTSKKNLKSIRDSYYPADQLINAFMSIQNDVWSKSLGEQKRLALTSSEFYQYAPQVITSVLSRRYVGHEFIYTLVVNRLDPISKVNEYYKYETYSEYDLYLFDNPAKYISEAKGIQLISENDFIDLTGILINPLFNRG